MASSRGWFFLCLIFFLGWPIAGQSQMIVQKGILDLQDTTFKKQIPMSGEWEFYSQQLYNIQEIQALDTPGYRTFPGIWGDSVPAKGYGTYHLTFVVDPDSANGLALSVPDFYTCYALYLNGEELFECGKVGTTPETAQPKWLNKVIGLPTLPDTNHLVLQIANFWHSKGGPKEDIYIGKEENIVQMGHVENALDFILSGAIFMAGVFFLGLYFYGRHDRAILFFALFCLSYCYRVFGSGNYPIHTAFPEISWGLTIRIEYITLFMSVFFFGYYMRYLFPNETSRVAVHIQGGINLLFALTVLVTPASIFTRLITPFFVVLVVYIGYAFFVYLKAAYKDRIGARYSMVSTGVIFVVFLLEMMVYYGVLPDMQVATFLGYLGFFFFQSLILIYKFSTQLIMAKKEAEKASIAKSAFLSTMSHEIRTPLNAVIGITHHLLQESPREDQKENLNSLLFSAENLLVIVNDILDFNKIEAGKIVFENTTMNLVQLGENIKNVLQSQADKKGLKLAFDYDKNIPRLLQGDPTRTGQVITNLVHNAIKFTNEGEVRMSLTMKHKTSRRVAVEITISDTGVGIPDEKLERIFTMFEQADTSTTRSFGGTGLGLSIVKRILELQNINIYVESKMGQGTAFRFTQVFAIAEESGGQPEAQLLDAFESSTVLKGKRLLVVEDNKINMMVVTKLLKKWQITFETAENGLEAVDYIRHDDFDMILMDLQMPEMDGYVASKIIREELRFTKPIVALTAANVHEVIDEIKKHGMNDLIMKPFRPDEMKVVLAKYLVR